MSSDTRQIWKIPKIYWGKHGPTNTIYFTIAINWGIKKLNKLIAKKKLTLFFKTYLYVRVVVVQIILQTKCKSIPFVRLIDNKLNRDIFKFKSIIMLQSFVCCRMQQSANCTLSDALTSRPPLYQPCLLYTSRCV